MLNPGDTLDDRYLITGELGQGGMSYVFRARDKHLEREVALKMLRPHLTDTDQERFRREIRALAKLKHPGIATIYDLGVHERVYFTMELVEGGLFTDLGPLESDPQPFTHLLSAAITVAEALDYVHGLGMVHRDLTPRNILMTRAGNPKVMDFGLVQLAETSRELTRTGLTLGTPQYMAPEQARGEPTGAHTDLYALGAVLYKAVTGVAPFDADNDQAVLYQHVYGDVTPVLELNPETPPALARLVELLLSKDANLRPSSGGAVAERMRGILLTQQTSASARRLGGPALQGSYPFGPSHPQRLNVTWEVKLPEGPQWPAALCAAEGFLILGLRSEEVRVLRPADGRVQASFGAPDEVNTAPLFLGDRLLVNSRDGGLFSLGWPSGETLWEDEDARAVGTVPAGADFLVSTTRATAERRGADNSPLWSYAAESAATTGPCLHQGHVCFMTQEGWMHAVDASTGKGKFKIELGPVVAGLVAKDGVLLLPEREGELHAFDLKTKDVLWSYDMEGSLWAAPVCWHDYVFTVSWANRVRCVTLRSGDDVWSFGLPSPATATPIVAAGVLYIVTEGGQLIALDAGTGRLLFEDAVSLSPIQASPLVVGDALIAAALDGTVRAYQPDYRDA